MTDTTQWGTPEEVGPWFEYMKCRSRRYEFEQHRWPKAPASDDRLRCMASRFLREQHPQTPIEAEILSEIAQSINCLPPNDLRRFSEILANLVNEAAL